MAAFDTGAGATIVFGTTGFSADITRMSLGSETREVLEVADLSMTDYIEKEPADLSDPGEIEIEYYFDTLTAAAEPPAINSPPETVTVTFPLRSGETTAATLAGTAFVVGKDWPELALNEGQMGTLRYAWDAKTGPAFTKASAA